MHLAVLSQARYTMDHGLVGAEYACGGLFNHKKVGSRSSDQSNLLDVVCWDQKWD